MVEDICEYYYDFDTVKVQIMMMVLMSLYINMSLPSIFTAVIFIFLE